MYRIMGEITGPVRHALMTPPDFRAADQLDARSDLAMLRRALASAERSFTEIGGEVYVRDGNGKDKLFNAFNDQQDALSIYHALEMSGTQVLWIRRLATANGQKSAPFSKGAKAWRRAVVEFAAALTPAKPCAHALAIFRRSP